LLKSLVVAALLTLAGCKIIFTNLPTFYSHNDLKNQQIEIENFNTERID
tara:strand:+ start:220 stop:366 length:147 start_codon:yes stop_codon:yes gene_type:complete